MNDKDALEKLKEQKRIANKKYREKKILEEVEQDYKKVTEKDTQEIKSESIITKEECQKEPPTDTENWIWNMTTTVITTIGQTMLQVIGMAAIPVLMKMFLPTQKAILSAQPLKQEETQSNRAVTSLDSL